MPFTYNMLTTSQSDPLVSDNLSAQLDFQRCHSYASFDGGLTHHDGHGPGPGQECATGIHDISIVGYTACTPGPSAAARAPAPLDLDWDFALDADSDSESEESPTGSLSPDEYPERASEPFVGGPSAAASATITTPSSTPCFSASSFSSSSSSSGVPPAGPSSPPAPEAPAAASTSEAAPRRQGRPHARSIHKKPRSYDLHDDFVHAAAAAQAALMRAYDGHSANSQSSSAVETSEAQAPGPVAPSVSMPAYIRTAETKGFYALAHRRSCPGFATGHVSSH